MRVKQLSITLLFHNEYITKGLITILWSVLFHIEIYDSSKFPAVFYFGVPCSKQIYSNRITYTIL